MKTMFRIWMILVLGLCVGSQTSWAQESLTIGVGISKPPYVIQKNNTGMELEIVRRALELGGYQMKPRYMPILRIPHELNGGAIDGGIHLKAHIAIDGFFSDDVIKYRNYAVSRADHDEDISQLSDLKGKSIIAFQNAHKFLGNDYAMAVKGNPKYAEIANQALQVKMLAAGRVNFVIADFRIFLHFKQKYEAQVGKKLPVKFHKIFEPTPYRAAFRKRAVRDAFDQGLMKLRASGEYDQIIAKYIDVNELLALSN